MAKYLSKPIPCEAVQWTGDNQEEMEDLCDLLFIDSYCGGDAAVYNNDKGGWIHLPLRGYVVKHPLGYFYPVEEGSFEIAFDKVEETQGQLPTSGLVEGDFHQ